MDVELAKPAYCIEFFHAKPRCRKKLKKALLDLVEESRNEATCMQYDLLTDDANHDLFIIIAKFADADAMLVHEKQPYIVNFSNELMHKLCEKVVWHDAKHIDTEEE